MTVGVILRSRVVGTVYTIHQTNKIIPFFFSGWAGGGGGGAM